MLLIAALLGANKTESKIEPLVLSGYVSAYDESPTIGTAMYRYGIGDIPPEKSYYVASLSCDFIGNRAKLEAANLSVSVTIFDCAGDDGGYSWMRENDIVTEVGYYLRTAHPEMVGSRATLTVYNNE